MILPFSVSPHHIHLNTSKATASLLRRCSTVQQTLHHTCLVPLLYFFIIHNSAKSDKVFFTASPSKAQEISASCKIEKPFYFSKQDRRRNCFFDGTAHIQNQIASHTWMVDYRHVFRPTCALPYQSANTGCAVVSNHRTYWEVFCQPDDWHRTGMVQAPTIRQGHHHYHSHTIIGDFSAGFTGIRHCVVFFLTITAVAGHVSAGQLSLYILILIVVLPLFS